jgi:sulfide dehydrogenase cytochrome subunit
MMPEETMHLRTTLLLLFTALAAQTALASDIDALARTCNNCHGVNGVSAGPSMPSIGGQSEAYLKNVMLEWKNGDRYSATMGRLIKGYSDEDIAALAKYFSKLPWKPVAQKLDPGLVQRGEEVADRCSAGHGETGGDPGDEDTPKLNGQWGQFMELELEKYRDDGIHMPSKAMTKAARKLDPADIEAVAQFYASHTK